jgi:HD-GYP domain-containing protein (c-di-GMP phosphodiesterase class II)
VDNRVAVTGSPPGRVDGLAGLAGRYFAHDVDGRPHAQRVARLAVQIGGGFGLERAELLAIAVGALLHDVGKLAVPASVLEKPGELTEQEWASVRAHPLAGEQLVSSHLLPTTVRSIVRWHHERIDGLGYPDGLCAEQIPLSARIVSVADAYEAMVGARPYSPPRTCADALGQLLAHAGDQFDPACVARLTEVVGVPDVALVYERTAVKTRKSSSAVGSSPV